MNRPLRSSRKVRKDNYKMDIEKTGKAIVNSAIKIHKAQLLTYLKVSEVHLGFLLNWNVRLMKDGIKRMVNNLQG